jgi:hypothetical protein
MIQDDMICKYDTKAKAKAKAKLQRKPKLVYNTQKFPSPKKGNKLQAPLTSEQTGLGQEVW